MLITTKCKKLLISDGPNVSKINSVTAGNPLKIINSGTSL
jgi:hypothetical protein